MDFHSKLALACISNIFLFHCCSCDELSDGPGTINWTCACASGPVGPQNSLLTDCSSVCNCTHEEAVGVPDEKRWICLCASERPPQTLGIHNSSCFTACNCTSGSLNKAATAKKHSANKIVVLLLLLCIMLTTIAFVASVACYLHQKDRFLPQSWTSSFDRDTSWNSATNLISHQSASLPEFEAKRNSHSNLFKGIIQKASFMFKSSKGTLPGIIVQFSFIELEDATDKFSSENLIGLGGSSKVYRGQLKDGRVVAIKRLMMLGDSDEDSGFLTEIEVISRLNHFHVVPLLGYCSETRGKHLERLLVFEYMTNGNLRDCLDVKQGKEPLDWETRVVIAYGAAKGLEYLHEAAAPRILHRDVKSTNILLDVKYRAKITDLGMAKRLLTDDLTSCTNSPARMLGTFGYFAPEYANMGKASLKSDVFSFGVVIVELMTGHQPIRRSSNKNDESLIIWATPLLHDSNRVVSELPDPLLKGNFPAEEMQVMAHLARECLQWDPDYRPTMSEVVHILDTISSDKSKRRRFPATLFVNPSTNSIKNIPEIENHEELPDGSIEIVDMRPLTSGRWHARRSLPWAVDRTLCEDQRNGDGPALSAGYMERLVLQNAQTSRSPDDESVDLTEPRFESFFQVNIQSL